MKIEVIERSETSAIRTQTPRIYPKENILHTEHGESLKSWMLFHVEVMFNQMLNLLERYYVYLHSCLLSLSSHKIVEIAD